jgi:FtsP/CotA-like multicopper oxidase with cupredoxin domain
MNRRDLLRYSGLAIGGILVTNLTTAQRRPLTQHRSAYKRISANVVEVQLEASEQRIQLGPKQARLMTYNSSFPGPILRVREGDTVRLNFTNRLREPTNLHLHGLRISPAVDAPLLEIPPGGSHLYEFTVPKGSSGTHFYHPHVHGRVAAQMGAGLVGAMIVEGPLDAMPELRDAEEHVIVLKDLALVNGTLRSPTMMDWMNGTEGVIYVNGSRTPTLRASKATLRLRFVNASNARYYHLRLEDHAMHLIASDGGLIEKPVALETLLLAPGERAEVLVQLEREGSFRLGHIGYDRGRHSMGMGMMGNGMGSDQASPINQFATLLTLIAPANSKPLALPDNLMPVEKLEPSKAVVTRRIVMKETMMPMGFFLNGKSFDHKRVDFSGKRGTLEVWELENQGDMDHPFHLHSFPFQVLERNGIPEPYRAWKDTVNLRKNDRLKIAVPLRDFTGLTVYHCHIVEHEDRGMMGTLEVLA